jgi:dipeptidyl aminopeptidase/acylaminoacyl peptidase
MRRLLPVLMLALFPPAAAAQFQLTVPRIMRGPENVGREPSGIRFSPDGGWIYFRWLPPGTDWKETVKPYRVRATAGAVPERLSAAQADSLEPSVADGPLSPDRTRRVTAVRGDLYLVDLPLGTVRRLTNTPAVSETDPSFDREGRRILFRRDNNIFAMDLTRTGVQQLTDIRSGPAPEEPKKAEGQRAFLETEEARLLSGIRDRRWRDSVDKAEREARSAGAMKPFYLAPGEQVRSLVPSPSGQAVLVHLGTPPKDRRTAQVPSYVTISGYTEELPARTKVGDQQDTERVGILSVANGQVTWIRPIASDSSGVFGNLFSLGWNEAGTSALLYASTRDYTLRHLVRVDASPVAASPVDVLRDTAWVGGPCDGCGGWLPGNQGFWFLSEADGYNHLYTVRADGTGRVQRTRGKWEVEAAELTPDGSRWLLHTSEASSYERQAYLMDVAAGGPARLTTDVGGHTVTLSPDGTLLADVFSTANRPPELFVQDTRGGGRSQLTTSPTKEWLGFHWIVPEIVKIPASDGVQVPAHIYRPGDMGAKPNGAAVIFVHGAGYLHNVTNYWSYYYREYQFHHLLASKGYVVLDLDYRGSAGYGRDWRTAIYRHMGGRDLQDQVDAVRWLTKRYGISPERVGIYGGSYGGFITLMALFTEPRSFGAGAALRPVTDWAHYNHGYTAEILNEPQDDSTAYRQSSPIYFAEGLEDPLLIAHGMVDVNVHFQDVVRLTQRLIELGKTDWNLAAYPLEDHGFVRPDSWTDEYRRILDLFETRLRRK